MATVKEQVKEKLVGTEQESQSSGHTGAEYYKHAIKDEESGEYYLTEQGFIDAIAPEGEDYVGTYLSPVELGCGHRGAERTCACLHYETQAYTPTSTRSSATSIRFSSASPTVTRKAGLACKSGASSTTCSRSPTPNMKSLSAFSPTR